MSEYIVLIVVLIFAVRDIFRDRISAKDKNDTLKLYKADNVYQVEEVKLEPEPEPVNDYVDIDQVPTISF